MASLPLENYSGSPSDEFVGKIVSSATTEPKIGQRQFTKGAIAGERGSGLSQLDRLLDPQNTSVSLITLARAAALSGKRLVVEIRDQHPVTVIESKAKRSPSSPLDVCINRCNSLREFATLRLPIFPCAGIPTLNNPHRLLDLFDGLG